MAFMKAQPPSLSLPRFVGRRELGRALGLSQATIFRMEQRGDIPRPLRLSPGRVAWPENVIREWIDQRAR